GERVKEGLKGERELGWPVCYLASLSGTKALSPTCKPLSSLLIKPYSSAFLLKYSVYIFMNT
ncbi:MAG: hypothetical protein ACFNVO_11720, partial [Prevotella sp.]